MKYPNQKRIKIQREIVNQVKDTGRNYLIAYQDNLLDAMKSLTPAAFKVYMCLLFNANGYILDFSPEHFSDMTGLCRDTVRKSLALLRSEGFIEYEDTSKYKFRENRLIDFKN